MYSQVQDSHHIIVQFIPSTCIYGAPIWCNKEKKGKENKDGQAKGLCLQEAQQSINEGNCKMRLISCYFSAEKIT